MLFVSARGKMTRRDEKKINILNTKLWFTSDMNIKNSRYFLCSFWTSQTVGSKRGNKMKMKKRKRKEKKMERGMSIAI